MAEKQTGAASALTNNSLFAAVLAVAGALYLNSDAALERVRPDAFEASPASHAYHDIEARSWQDPLAAAEAHRQADADGNPDCRQQRENKHCAQLIEEIAGRPDATVLAVMIPGGPFNEDAEVRRRLRYAVFAGLAREEYFPDDPQRLDYFRFSARGSKEPSMDLPYEWFRPGGGENNSRKNVLILWVNEDGPLLNSDPSGGPVAAFKKLFDRLAPSSDLTPKVIPASDIAAPFLRLSDGSCRTQRDILYLAAAQISGGQPIVAAPNKCGSLPPSWRLVCGDKPVAARPARNGRIAILGPWGSDMYLRINRELRKSGAGSNAPKFYVYGASIAEEALRTELSQEYCAPFRPAWRTIPDNELSAVLVDELDKRGLCSIAPQAGIQSAVALLSDTDSLYGRSIVETVAKEIKRRCEGECGKPRCLFDKVAVKRISYLRGLDGSLPGNQKNGGEQGKSEERPAGKAQNGEKIDVRAFDRPFGPSQADYLRHIADDLKEQSHSQDIRAIGVLGNDVYDKLWVLRALKPEFPNAIFFTTDYDAALGMKSELKYTRNLLVASAFGDGLDAESRDIATGNPDPPFRASYQTSVFLAIRKALRDAASPSGIEKETISPDKPKLFEISRDGRPFELTAEKILESANMSWTTAFFAGLIVAAAWLFFLCRQREKDTREKYLQVLQLKASIMILVALLVVVALVSLFWRPLFFWLTGSGNGEPVGVFDGVGAWPVIALHLLLAFFSAVLTWLALENFRKNGDEVHRLFFSGPEQRPTKLDEKSLRHLIDPFLAYRIDAFAASKVPFDVEKGWSEYVAQARWPLRLGRCLIWSVIALFLFALLGGFDSSPPMRSVLARELYALTLGANFFAACVLTLLIFDATVLGVSFVYGLGRDQSEWPKETRKEYSGKLGLIDPPKAVSIGFLGAQFKKPEEDQNQQSRNSEGTDPDNAGLLDDWIDLVFIEEHTGFINMLVFYPFLAVALSLLAHSAWLSAYPGSPLIAIAEGVGLFVIFCCALALRCAAERARRKAVRKFDDEIVKTSEKPREPGKWSRDQLESLLARIRALDEGAFSPLLEQPIVKALLLPIGSLGLTALQGLPGFLRF